MQARSSLPSWTLLLFLVPWTAVAPSCNDAGDGAPDGGGADGGAPGDAGPTAAVDAGDAGAPGDGGLDLDGGGTAVDGGAPQDGGITDAGVLCADAGVIESSLTVTTSSQRFDVHRLGRALGRGGPDGQR